MPQNIVFKNTYKSNLCSTGEKTNKGGQRTTLIADKGTRKAEAYLPVFYKLVAGKVTALVHWKPQWIFLTNAVYN